MRRVFECYAVTVCSCDVDAVQRMDRSMTVNTKEAYNMVMGMFNQLVSDDSQDNYPLENVDFERRFALDTG